ncbi:hypothetical protein ACF6ZU_22930 [Pseudomonas migulae]|jgi:hypothetical protein|uniref:hypothetical protein n=1 Tax=Pseudomonas migulae TaxID=78543 RepID=UPI0037142533
MFAPVDEGGGFPCRSEPARDGLQNAAFTQTARVIVNDHRERARSYNGISKALEGEIGKNRLDGFSIEPL